MTARGKKTMRAVLERNTQAAPDDSGALGPPDWTVLVAELPCYLYERLRPIRYVDGNKTATVSDLICMVPKGTDVVDGDRLNGVVDRLGRIQHATPLKVRGTQRRAAWGHLELILIDSST